MDIRSSSLCSWSLQGKGGGEGEGEGGGGGGKEKEGEGEGGRGRGRGGYVGMKEQGGIVDDVLQHIKTKHLISSKLSLQN